MVAKLAIERSPTFVTTFLVTVLAVATTLAFGQETGKPDRQEQSQKVVRQPDPVLEPTFPRNVIYQNLAEELGVDEETAKRLLVGLESQMPLREAVMLLILANATTEKQIEQGGFSERQKKDALLKSIDSVRALIEQGVGWGTLGSSVGVDISGGNLNAKSNVIIGQR